MKNKKGISGVIETVLLVLITLMAVGILSAFIIPMIRHNLDQSSACLNIGDKISINFEDYTCTDSARTLVQIDRKMNDDSKLESLIFSISAGGTAKRFEIINGSAPSDELKMYQSGKILVPNSGDTLTYNFTIGNATTVKIVPVMDGGITCDEISGKIINRCINV